MSFLFGRARFSLLILSAIFILAGCQNFQVKTKVQESADSSQGETHREVSVGSSGAGSDVTSSEVKNETAGEDSLPDVLVAKTPTKQVPRFGFIFGPGGAKAFAHAGFIQELQARKVPVHAVSGIEWGAFVAGLYAYRASANDVQWQIGKIKGEDVYQQHMISRQITPGNMDKVEKVLGDAVGSTMTDKTRIPFSCPAYALGRSESFIMSRSQLRQAVSYCMPLPPLLMPYKGYVASPMDLAPLVRFMRSQGANYIVYVSVLGPQALRDSKLDTSSAILWNFADHRKLARFGVDASLSIPVNEYSIMDIDRSREIVAKGSDSSKIVLDKFLASWGL